MTPWDVAHQAPLSVGFPQQEYWSGLPFPSPGDLPDPGIEPRSPALQADSLPSEPPGKRITASMSQVRDGVLMAPALSPAHSSSQDFQKHRTLVLSNNNLNQRHLLSSFSAERPFKLPTVCFGLLLKG